MKIKAVLVFLYVLTCVSVSAQKVYIVGIQGKSVHAESRKSLTSGLMIGIDVALSLWTNGDAKTYSYSQNGGFENVKRSVDSINVTKDDIIVVYYNGLGGRNPKDVSPCPQLCYEGNASNAISADSLTQYFLDKGARFYMFIYDTNNSPSEMFKHKSSVNFSYPPNNSQRYFSSYKGGKTDYYTLNKLFSKKGYVIINAAEVGTDAFMVGEKSILTEAISSVFLKPAQDWDKMKLQITEKVKALSDGKQTPTFIMHIE